MRGKSRAKHEEGRKPATCRVCHSALVRDHNEVRCAACVGRCVECGEPADPETAGFPDHSILSEQEPTGRYCSIHAEVTEVGLFRLWGAVFRPQGGESASEKKREKLKADGEAFLVEIGWKRT